MGVSKKFPHRLVYGPQKEGGLGLDNLYTTQGLAQLVKLQDI